MRSLLRYSLILFLLLSLPGFSQNSKGDSYYKQGQEQLDKKEAEKALQFFLKARNEYIKEGNLHWALTSMQNVATYYQDTNNGEAAKKIILETIAAIPQKTKEEISTHASLQDNLGYTYANVLNDPEKALACYSESIRLYGLIDQANTPMCAFELTNRATTYFSLNNFQAAVDDQLKAISIYENDKETNPDDLARKIRDLGRMYAEMSYENKALEAYQKAKSIIPADNKALQAMLLNDMGGANMRLNKLMIAMGNYRESLALNEQVYGKDASNYALTLLNIAELNRKMGDLDQALINYQEVLLIYQKTPPEDLSNIIDAMVEVSSLLNDLGLNEKQEEVLTQAQNFAVTAFGANSLQEADVYTQKAN
ncbi:MAG TPA: hypothetical protein DGG95_04400, partial [Cytophagales bacterium]|nr:hypothetical protein [Cytophagales bacterium]